MCGRFALAAFLKRLEAIFGANFGAVSAGEYAANLNIAPSSDILMVANGKDGGRKIIKVRWGLVPQWQSDNGKNSVLFNARSETLLQKPSFKDAFIKRRCIIPADGFYEWATEGKTRTPYFVERSDNMPLAFAGLWEMKRLTADEILLSASIITTAASEQFAPIHHRFPVVLEPPSWGLWLDKNSAVPDLQNLFHAPNDAILRITQTAPPLK